jgi:hypothetical protein
MREDKKVTIPELIRLRRSMELREYALAAFYPRTHSGSTAHRKRAEDELPVTNAHPLLTALCNIHSPTDLATVCREAAARDAVTPHGERIREHGYQRLPGDPNEPKPWKKPWDR